MNLTEIAGTSSVGEIPVGKEPGPMVYDARDGDLHVRDCGSNRVSVVIGTAVQATVTVGYYPFPIVSDGKDGYVCVTVLNDPGKFVGTVDTLQ